MNNQVSVSRRGFLAGLGALSAISVAACSGGSRMGSGAESQAARFDKLAEVDGNFTYNAADDGVEYHHSDMLSPNYYVFAGKKDADGAAELVGQLGLAESIEAYVGQVTVVNPKDGDAYTTTDADAFVELAAAAGPANNVKVIGIDAGADFVLGDLAPKLYFVAGIMTFGGSDADAAGIPFVPAYLSGAPQAAADALIAANGAEEVGDGVCENPDDPLRRVVVADDADAASAFANCWEKVFSKELPPAQ